MHLVNVCAGETVARDAELHRHRRAGGEREAYRRAGVGGEGAAVDAARRDGCVVEVHGDDAPVCGLEGGRDLDAQRGGAAEDEDGAGREGRALAEEAVWVEGGAGAEGRGERSVGDGGVGKDGVGGEREGEGLEKGWKRAWGGHWWHGVGVEGDRRWCD